MSNVLQDASLKDFRCATCSKTFVRAEHLRRHALIHEQNRPFQCRGCSKTFIRRDALQRHEATHGAAPSLLARGGRACYNCASAKARCSGEKQCSRCRQRHVACDYPNLIAANGPDVLLPSPPPNPESESFDLAQPFAQPVMAAPDPQPGALGFDVDFWDHQNVLSSTNWLDAADFFDFPLPQTPPNQDLFLPNSAPHLTASSAAVTTHPLPQAHTLTESPASVFSPHSVGNTSNTSYDGAPTEHGEYYVDGEPSRLPRVKRRKTSTAKRPIFSSPLTNNFSLQLQDTPLDIETRSVTINPKTFEDIQTFYKKLCLHPADGWAAFEQVDCPRKEVWESFVHLYFNFFDQSLPFIHHSSLEKIGESAPLILALAAIGTHYIEGSDLSVFVVSTHEFTRRLLLYNREVTRNEEPDMNSSAAILLHLVGMAYSGQRLAQYALDARQQLAAVFTQSRISAESRGQAFDQWSSWSQRESFVRLAYSAWLIDSMWTYHFGTQPLLSLQDAQIPLPCANKLWRAATGPEWAAMIGEHAAQPSLNEALQELYIDKQLPIHRKEFARILIIHGLFHRHWEVEKYHQNPLSSCWEPSASRQSSSELLPKSPIWLPSIPSFSKWQNSGCDALDVMHWQANAKIGQASGLEHPTVMHLHQARIVLLAPYKEMKDLAHAMVYNTAHHVSDSAANKHLIQRWAIQHQYKARLAAIHAGVVFWHVRRYSTDAFYEPAAVGLASLVLWAFGTFASKNSPSRSTSRPPDGQQQGFEQAPGAQEDSEQSDDPVSSIILLDRPTDDELVQQFIRRGHAMQAHISGVGDLYAPKGPERVLVQGCKLLSSLRCWGVGSTWRELLQGLTEVSRKGRSKG